MVRAQRPETLHEGLSRRNIRFPIFPGVLKLQTARPATSWMSDAIQIPTRATTRHLPKEIKDICKDLGMKDWEAVNQYFTRFGVMAGDRCQGDITTPLAGVNPLARATNEESVVKFFDRHLGDVVEKAVAMIAKSDADSDGKELDRIFSKTLHGKLSSRPERNVPMTFANDDELTHFTNMVASRNSDIRASKLSKKGASSEAGIISSPLKWAGRPDGQIGFEGLSDTNPPQTTKRKPVFQVDAEDDVDDQESFETFTSSMCTEHKAFGRLDEVGLKAGYGRRPTRTAPPQGPVTRSRNELANILAQEYGARSSFNTGTQRIITQLAAYAILCDNKHGIAFDANVLALVVFDDAKRGRRMSKDDRIQLGDDVTLGVINIRKTPRDIVLTTLLGFVVEAIVMSLQRQGQDCSRERLLELTTKFMEDHPDLAKILCTDTVSTEAEETEAEEAEAMETEATEMEETMD
ncbi:hypothetical protein B0T11DRAFT_296801 [Plectosphaerella cucumerina]|uniref:Uncharacterized protein n=1 Tax=Plectosphaerella cucumerina TaxID=40658 RepID=A0A8K0X6W2_9PEZI|nr:hypothetical protein B0T11DRAFT_296801 [Plectosphaerella cucumerina]